MSNVRQTILIRTDLKLKTGLLAAQVAHLHMEQVRQILTAQDKDAITIDFSAMGEVGADLQEWLNTPYIFVHGVPNKEALDYFAQVAREKKIIVTNWSDTIFLEFSKKQKVALPQVLVGIVLGPTDSDKIRSVIGDLPLL